MSFESWIITRELPANCDHWLWAPPVVGGFCGQGEYYLVQVRKSWNGGSEGHCCGRRRRER